MWTKSSRISRLIGAKLSLVLHASLAGCGGTSGIEGSPEAPDDDTSVDTPVVDTIEDATLDPDPDPDVDVVVDTADDTPPDPVDDSSSGGHVGDSCEVDADCTGISVEERTCLHDLDIGPVGHFDFPGGYCSRGCGSDADCGENGACLDLFIMRICFARCEDLSECRYVEGYSCEAWMWLPGPICAPPD